MDLERPIGVPEDAQVSGVLLLARLVDRHAAVGTTTRSSCDAVQAWASPSSSCSFAAVATRVSARTLAYDNSPEAKDAWVRRSCRRLRATRTCSRAERGASA